MKHDYVSIKVTDLERRIIINGLIKLKEIQIKEDKNYDFLDNLITRICESPIKKKYYVK